MALTEDVQRYEALAERLIGANKTRMLSLCRQSELTPPQLFALKIIDHLQRTKMSPLAAELGLSMGAASTLVDRLVTRNLVTRDTDANDRRAIFVSLSEKGHEVLEIATKARLALFRELFSLIEPEQREQVLDGLEIIAQAWEKLPQPDTEPLDWVPE